MRAINGINDIQKRRKRRIKERKENISKGKVDMNSREDNGKGVPLSFMIITFERKKLKNIFSV